MEAHLDSDLRPDFEVGGAHHRDAIQWIEKHNGVARHPAASG
jgi:hypothetical protein